MIVTFILLNLYMKVLMEMMKRSSLTKHQVLHWIGACLHGNITRKKVNYVFCVGLFS